MTAAMFLRWLLALLQGAPLPTRYEVLTTPAGSGGAEAIEVTIGSQTFRIRVEALG